MKAKQLINGTKIIYKDICTLVRREIKFHAAQPVSSLLFLTYRCDSKCKTCTMWQRAHDKEIERELNLADWKLIVDRLDTAGITNVELFGGNVLLRKEVLLGILEYLNAKGIAIHFPTNQIGLDDDIAEAIVNYVDCVYLSNDGLGETQNEIRGIQNASSLADSAVDRLLKIRKTEGFENSRLKIICNCTISKFNIEIMEDVVRNAIEKRYDEIHFEYVGEFDEEVLIMSKIGDIIPAPHYVRQEESILASRDGAIKIKKNISRIKKKYKKEPIRISTINIDSLSVGNLYNGTIPHKKCYDERNEVTIDPYGNVVICPFIVDYKLGKLLDSSVAEVWNNERHIRFRKAQNGGELPMCRHCVLGVQRNPGIMKSLHRIYLTRVKAFFL